MDDSIREYTKGLMARAAARDEVLRRQDNRTPAKLLPSTDLTLPPPKAVRFAIQDESDLDDSSSLSFNQLDAPTSPGNKENLARNEEDTSNMEQSLEDDENNDENMDDVSNEDGNVDDKEAEHNRRDEYEDEDENEDEDMEANNREMTDEVPPLSMLVSKPLARTMTTSGPQSASPVSRKSRLSALAESIKSWEEEVPTPPTKGSDITTAGAKSTRPRYSVSTPPPSNTNRIAALNKRSSGCHQFVAATPVTRSCSISPVKKPGLDPTPTKTTTSYEGNPSLTPTKPKPIMSSSPIKSISSLDSPAKVVASPAPASPVKCVKLNGKESDESGERKLAVASPSRQNLSPRKSTVSPLKSLAEGLGDSVAKNLEFQGFVKVDANQGSSAAVAPPSKIAGSILNKKRMFEKDGGEKPATPAPKLSKPSSAWPQVGATVVSSLAHNKPVTTQANSSSNLTPLQQFHSRKSLQVDPSELTVAQKARLFERQQEEQERLRNKEQETNQWLNMGRSRGAPSSSTTIQQKKIETEKVQSPQKSKRASEQTEKPQSYYFGQQQDSTIPPPPPPPPTNKAETGLTHKHDDDSNSDDEEGFSPNKNNISPSMLIAKSVKPIKVLKKNDKMYPSLTDIENTETEDNETNTSSVGSSPVASCSFNSSMSTSSLGSFIQGKAAECSVMDNNEINTTMACQQIDDLIDQALEGQIVEDTFMMEAHGSDGPAKGSSPVGKQHVSQPLVHSVSMYRRNQRQLKTDGDSTTFKVPQNLDLVPEESEMNEKDLKDRIQVLDQQVAIQHRAILQASKALNICESSFEFSNSTENIEGERVLLVATQKRAQLLSYIGKLKNGNKADNGEFEVSPSKDKFRPSSSTRGIMKIDTIQLYPVNSTRLHQDYAYHFIVLLKYNEQVFTTTTVKTSASNTIIEFPSEFVIPELDPGFKVQVEVYALRTFKDMDAIPHNMKYHIKNPDRPQSSSSTPSKTSTLSQFLTPTRSSRNTPKATNLKSSTPARGGATPSIRSSNFTLQAKLNLNLSNLNKTEWEMSMVNSNLILPNISMRIKCSNKNELTFRGFLTVFSDISGLGAWHRRWAMLDEDFRLLFWTYPEDEASEKPPVLTLDLSTCMTPRISPAPRDICARPNTFLLVTTRKPLPTDKDSLVMSVNEKYTAIKNMYCSDSRSERDAWIAIINKVLTNMRAWGINSSDSGFKTD